MKQPFKQAFKPKDHVHCEACPDISGFPYDNYLKNKNKRMKYPVNYY